MQLSGILSKFGLSAILGFLVGLVAVYVIAPVTADGRLLLVATAMCVTVVIVQLTVWLVGLFRRRPSPPAEQADER